MKVKDVDVKKIEKLLNDTDKDLCIVNITFEGRNPVLNLYKPFDDTDKRKEETEKNLSDILDWIAELEQKNRE